VDAGGGYGNGGCGANSGYGGYGCDMHGDGGSSEWTECSRPQAPPDYDRKIVVAHNRDSSGDPSNVYEVFNLSQSGQITPPGVTFEMGSGEGEIVFTPDGKYGIVAQGQGDNRSLGLFRFNDDGLPEVMHAEYIPPFYPGHIAMSTFGMYAFVVDTQWAEHGGGVYRVDIGCNGTITKVARVLETDLPAVLLPQWGNRGFLASWSKGPYPSREAHMVTTSTPMIKHYGVGAFGDDEAIVASAAVTYDGQYGLLGDDSMFGGNRVGVVRIIVDTVYFEQVISSVPAPVAMVASPFNDTVLVVSEYPDDLHVLDYNSEATSKPFSLRGKLDYVGKRPELPHTAVMISRGSLMGHVLVAELSGIRQVQFVEGGDGIVDMGLYSTGNSFVDMVGAIGVQK